MTYYTTTQTSSGARTAMIYVVRDGRYAAYRPDGSQAESGSVGDGRFTAVERGGQLIAGEPSDVDAAVLRAILAQA